MNYDIIFLGENNNEWNKFKSHYPRAHRMPSNSDFDQLKSKSFTKMFWVVWDKIQFNYKFDLNSYRADQYDNMFVHIFKNGNTFNGVCLFPKDLNPSNVEFKHKFFINRKEVNIKASDPVKQDNSFEVVFISYNETNAEKNFRLLTEKVPDAHRIHGVKGIHNAHIQAARLVNSGMFYVVDGDAEIEDSFYFNHNINEFEQDTVYVWASQNPVNELIYGYGGVKLLPTKQTLDIDPDSPDMTTAISGKFSYIDTISNKTMFNTDPFSAWKSGFRECVKLSSNIISRQNQTETIQRLDTWCNVGANKPFGTDTIKGAIEGRRYGEKHKNNSQNLALINDFDWLKTEFKKNYG